MQCELTRYMIAIPTYDCTAITAAKCLLEHLLLKHNFPTRIVSDNAQAFLSKVLKELTRLLSIKRVFTTIYSPKSNLVERGHRTMGAFLKAYVSANKSDWSELLPYAMFSYNNTVHSTTGFSPHFLVHGYNIIIPNKLTTPKTNYDYQSYADIVRNRIAASLKIARENLRKGKLKSKKYYDRGTAEVEIKENDMVLIQNKTKDHKFDSPYEGPYKVLSAHDVYLVIQRNGKKVKVHKNMTKKAQADYGDTNSNTRPAVELNSMSENDAQELKSNTILSSIVL